MCCAAARRRNAADSFLYKVMSSLQCRVEPAWRNHSKTDYSFKTKISPRNRTAETQNNQQAAHAHNKGHAVDSAGF